MIARGTRKEMGKMGKGSWKAQTKIYSYKIYIQIKISKKNLVSESVAFYDLSIKKRIQNITVIL